MIIDDRLLADDTHFVELVSRRKAAAMLVAFGGVTVAMPASYAQGVNHKATQLDDSVVLRQKISTSSPSFGLVRFDKDAFLPIAVQSIGGPLPHWVEADDAGTHCVLEIALVREKLPISDRANVEKAMRIMLVDEVVVDAPLPECLATISVKNTDLDTVAETLVGSVSGRTIVGIDFADIQSSASFRFGSTFQSPRLRNKGHAMVVHGSCGEPSSRNASRRAVRTLANMGFDGGLFVSVQIAQHKASGSVDSKVSTSFLYDFDTLMRSLTPEETTDRPFMVTATMGASRSAITIIAFNGRLDDARLTATSPACDYETCDRSVIS